MQAVGGWVPDAGPGGRGRVLSYSIECKELEKCSYPVGRSRPCGSAAEQGLRSGFLECGTTWM